MMLAICMILVWIAVAAQLRHHKRQGSVGVHRPTTTKAIKHWHANLAAALA
jgi:hypothetical protein